MAAAICTPGQRMQMRTVGCDGGLSMQHARDFSSSVGVVCMHVATRVQPTQASLNSLQDGSRQLPTRSRNGYPEDCLVWGGHGIGGTDNVWHIVLYLVCVLFCNY